MTFDEALESLRGNVSKPDCIVVSTISDRMNLAFAEQIEANRKAVSELSSLALLAAKQIKGNQEAVGELKARLLPPFEDCSPYDLSVGKKGFRR